jgi:hypothetical protein
MIHVQEQPAPAKTTISADRKSAIVLAVFPPPRTLLDDDTLNRYQIGNLDGLVSLLQRLQKIDTLTEHQLSEDIFVIVSRKYIRAVFHDTGRIDDYDATINELGRHGVADDTQGKRFATATILLHDGYTPYIQWTVSWMHIMTSCHSAVLL